MRRRPGAGLEVLAALALIAAYAGLSHYCNRGGHAAFGACLALAPFVILGASLLRRVRHPLLALASGIAAAVVLVEAWPLLERNFSLIYLFQECGLYGLLAVGFARSLMAGETPLCTRLADQLHGPLTPAEMRYTRLVTFAWSLLLAAITTITLGLYLLAPIAAWSAFDNFVVFPLIAISFIVEHAVRRHVLPKADRGGILATVRIFLASR